jgi:tyrosinase
MVTMKSLFSILAGVTTILSFLGIVQAADGPSCAVYKPDDSSYFSVVGVQGTGVRPRQDIRELEKDTELWNIFLQALARFQAMGQKEKTSYYQIAGKTLIYLQHDHL